jgi:hypothetical protein
MLHPALLRNLMTTITLRKQPAAGASCETLAALRTHILDDQGLPPGRRRDIASALSSLAKAVGRPLDIISAEPATLRSLLGGMTAAQMGHRPGRWRNIRSLVSAALARTGQIQVPTRLDLPPSPAWAALLDKPLPRDAACRLGALRPLLHQPGGSRRRP